MSKLETAVLQAILAGDHEVLAGLREQMPTCRPVRRDTNTAGFATTLDVDRSLAPATRSIEKLALGGIHAELPGLQHGAGFVLFVRDGYLDVLEGFSYADEIWPEHTDEFVLSVVPELRAETLKRLD